MAKAYNIKKDIAAFVAEKHGVSADYVRKVMRSDRKDRSLKAQAIIDSYMTELEARKNRLKHTSVNYNFQRA